MEFEEEICSEREITLVDIYRDFPAFYAGLSAKDKCIFWVWLKTENVSLFAHLFAPLLSESVTEEIKIVVPKGQNCFTFVRT